MDVEVQVPHPRAADDGAPAGRPAVAPAGTPGRAGQVAMLAPVVLLPAAWAVLVTASPAIGHDEAVYANGARSLVTDLPATGWAVYRPPGLAVLGAPVLAAGGGLTGLRVLGLVFAGFTLVVLFALVRRWSGRATGSLAGGLAVLAALSAPPLLRRVPEYLNDLLCAGLLLVLLALLVEVRRGEHPVRLPLAAGVAVLAFYVRYGAVSSVVAVLLAVVLVHGVRVWWRERVWVALAAAVGVVGAVPHLLASRADTGSPFGALLAAGQVAGGVPLGAGTAWYLAALVTGLLAGPLGTVLAVAGLAGAWRAARTARLRRNAPGGPVQGGPDERWLVTLVVAALLQLLLVGLPSHPEPRFVFFAVLALVGAGAHTVAVALAGHPRRVGALVAVAVLAVPATAAVQLHDIRRYAADREVVARAGHLVPPKRPCAVAGAEVSALGWYSGCPAVPLDRRIGSLPRDVTVTVVWVDRGRRPAEALAALASRGPVRSLVLPGAGRWGDAHLELGTGRAR